MFKKYKIVAAICAVGLLSGFTTQTADASASFGGDNQAEVQQPSKTDTQNQDQGKYYFNSFEEMQQFMQNCFSNWDINWNKAPEQAEKPAPQPEEVTKPEANPPAPQPETETPKEENQNESQASALNQFEQEVVELTNQEREKHGLSALKVDNELSKVARDKSKDMQVNRYFDHNSPTYGSPFDMMQAYGIDYRAAGENIARGQRTPAEVVNGWMNSEGHRANILNGSFTHIGVGYVEDGNYWTQQFIGK